MLGPESRIITQLTDDRLDVFYVLQVLNSARTPVDIGGPLILDLPTEARGAALMDQPPPNATINGTRLTITGPFPPGPTAVSLAFELPFSGGSVNLDQKFPVAVEQPLVLVPQTGGLDVTSPALPQRRTASDQGQPLTIQTGPALAAGSTLRLTISGLPHHALWPRYLALTLAGIILTIGIWAAAFPPPQARRAPGRA